MMRVCAGAAARVPFWGHFGVARGDVLFDDFVVRVVLPGRCQFLFEGHDLRQALRKLSASLSVNLLGRPTVYTACPSS